MYPPQQTQVAVKRLPAPASAPMPEPIVLLHGWGGDSEIWQPLVAELNPFAELWLVDLPGFGGSAPLPDYSLPALIERLLPVLPARAVYVGWSLGGMLATALAARYPARVSGLITLATNLAFVTQDDWSPAMPRGTFEQFLRSFEDAPAATLKRFTALEARGDVRERTVLKWLREHQPAITPPHPDWRNALQLLAQIDNRRAFAALTRPGLHILGQADALVPAALAGAIPGINSTQQVVVLPAAGHALHISEPRRTAGLIRDFLAGDACAQRENHHLDKRQVAASFSRAAATYDAVADLQRWVGERLSSHLPEPSGSGKKPGTVLDLGCGTGYFSGLLGARWPGADLIGLDLAEGMLRYAQQRRPDAGSWLCGDAEMLPLADASVDLIFSSLTIQWCRQLPRLLVELKRVLKPGGRLLFSTLGPDTLQELRSAWRHVDGFTHVNHFIPATVIQRELQRAGFGPFEWQSEYRVLRYRELRELTHELKALGAHNVNAGRRAGLTGRKRLEAFKNAYEQFRTDGVLPATYEIYYCRVQA